MSVTDAKPLLPENVTNLFVEFSEVWVHKPGQGWIELDLAEPAPYSIDLLQFYDGHTTELVPPAILDAGKYTQVRIVVSGATMRFENGDEIDDITLEIPNNGLKTDKNFIIDLGADSAMDIVIHFDLSMSVVVSGTPEEPIYKLKPVLHLFGDPLQAATIVGELDNFAFGASAKATVVVKTNEEDYTEVEISKSEDVGTTTYEIYWIVPNQEYTVEIDIKKDDPNYECEKTIGDEETSPGAVVSIGICPTPT